MPTASIHWLEHYPGGDITAPAVEFQAVTPSDATDLTRFTRALYIGVGGNVVCVDFLNNVVTFVGVTAGSVLPIRVARVNATGTTATSIVALY